MSCLEPLFGLLAVAGVVIGALALRRIAKIEQSVALLRTELGREPGSSRAPALAGAAGATPVSPVAPPAAPPSPVSPSYARAGAPEAALSPAIAPPVPPRPVVASTPARSPLAIPHSAPPAAPAAPRPTRWTGLEELVGARLFVWVGSLALALAGAFLVKVSFERGWISPSVRVTLGILFGLALLTGAEFLRRSAGGIAQALSAAGIADLFACFYAATHVYQLVSPAVGFALMGLTALVAVGLALRQGLIVAVIGLVGGFLTPALIQTGHPDARALFAYLLLLAVGLLAVAARRGWWWLTAGTVAGGLAWVAAWMVLENGTLADSVLWLDLFLIALAVTVFASRRLESGSGAIAGGAWLALLSLAAILPTLALTSALSGFGTEEWAFFLLLAAAILLLARLEPFYDLLSWLAAAAAAALLGGWVAFPNSREELLRYPLTAAAAGLLFTLAGWAGAVTFLRFPGKQPRSGRWASLAAASAVGFFLLARLGPPIPGFHWGIPALVLAALLLAGLLPFMARRSDPGMERAAAALAVGVTTLASLAVPLEFDNEWITLAWALEMLAVVFLAGRFRLPALPTLARLLALLVICRLLLNPAIASYPLGTTPFWNGLLPLYGLPLACFLLAARQLAKTGWHGTSEGGVAEFEWGALLVGAGLLTLEIRHAFHPDQLLQPALGFAEAGALAGGWMLLGWALLRAGRTSARQPLIIGGTGLFLLGVLAALVGPLLLANPWWNGDAVGSLPIVNLVLVVFGLSTALAALGAHELRRRGWSWPAGIAGVAAQLLAFTLVSLEVRQAFHGSSLNTGAMASSERYAYSAAWILLGLTLLVVGLIKKAGGRALRFGSLAVMLIAVGKVFLSDTARLSDLYRVVSFLGLGVSLLVLGFLYQRFVFRRAEAPRGGAAVLGAILFLLARASSGAMANTEFRRPIEVTAPGWVRVPLDLAALRHLEGGLRLIGPSGEQVPLRLTSYVGDTERRPVRVSEVRETPAGWTLRLDLGAGSPPHERLFLSFSRLTAAPAVAVEASADGQSWEPLATGDLFRLGLREGLERTSLAYLPTPARYLRLNWPRSAGFPRLENVEAETVPGRALVVASGGATCRVVTDTQRVICRLPLPAAGQTLRQLRLDVVSSGDIGYRLEQPRLATWQPLAAGVWRNPAGTARHTLSLPAEPLGADLLRLELDGGGTGPAPRLAGYGLELISQTIVFHAELSGRYTLSYGGIVAPPPPTMGETATSPFSEAAAASASWVGLGIEQASAIAPLPATAVAPGASLAGTHFRSSWSIAPGAARAGDLVRFDLPDEVYAEARGDLADLRLAVVDRQIPYVHWTPEEPTLVLERPDLSPMAEKGRHYSRLELTLPVTGLPLTDILLTAPPTPLVRPIGIRVPAPGPAGLAPRAERIIGRETWECVPQPPLPCRASVPLAGPAYRQIALRFADGDNPPLPHLDVSVWRRGDALFFVWPERGPVHLLAGAETLSPPVYDLAALADTFPGQETVRVVLQSGADSGADVVPQWTRWVLPATLAVAAALLLLLLRRILRPTS